MVVTGLNECTTHLEAANVLVKLTKSRLPPTTYEGKSLDNWMWQGRKDEADPVPENHQELWQALGKFHKPEVLFLLLYGTPGVGKTHLATAIGWQRMAGEHKRIVMYQTEVLLDTLRMSYEKGGYADLVEAVQDCHLLILDDMDAQTTTDWGRAKLDAIVDYRYSEGKQTLITANNPEKIPPRILDRCREGVIVRVRGESMRGKV